MSETAKAFLTAGLTVLGGTIALVLGQILTKWILEPLQAQAKLTGEIAEALIVHANTASGVIRFYGETLEELTRTAPEARSAEIRELEIERAKQHLKREWERADEARVLFRRQASQLMAVTHTIRLYTLWSKLGIVPAYEKVIEASSALIGLSNMLGEGEYREGRDERRLAVARHLGLKLILQQYGEPTSP